LRAMRVAVRLSLIAIATTGFVLAYAPYASAQG
jgi:hypothetical protein